MGINKEEIIYTPEYVGEETTDNNEESGDIIDYKRKYAPQREFKKIDNPGRNEPKLKKQQVEQSGNSERVTLKFSFTSGTGAGTQDYTGFGFQPTDYYIEAWFNGNNTGPAKSSIYYIDGTVHGYLEYPSYQSATSTRVIAVYTASGAGNRTRANHDSFLSDGIRLDFVDDDKDIEFIITAWK